MAQVVHADAAEINHDQGGQNLRKDAQSPIEIVFVIEQADNHPQQGGSTEGSTSGAWIAGKVSTDASTRPASIATPPVTRMVQRDPCALPDDPAD